MFESDDWDFDQDFLNDADEKAVKFYSQAESRQGGPAKKRKVEICNDLFSSSDIDDWATEVDEEVTQCNADKASRKNLILGMFGHTPSSRHTPELQNTSNTTDLSCKSNDSQVPRKNLVLRILEEGESNAENNLCVLNGVNNLRKNTADARVNDNVNSLRQSSTIVDKKPESRTSILNNTNEDKTLNNSQRRYAKTNFSNESKRRLLLDILEPPVSNNVGATRILEKNNSPSIKMARARSSKKMTLIRRFPGPAGLLPDDMGARVPPISCLKSLEETENDRLKDTSESKLAEYCSQNTNNLFTEGAWQLMLDDLPKNFLKGHEIATVKQLANATHCQSTKVKFLAGVLERIDHSHDNPPIILKDFTDSIRGIVHCDIPLRYPGLLEPNIVILLHDAGLLRTSRSLMANKYQVLVSPSSLLGIYSNKGIVVRTRRMESILGLPANEKDNCSNDANIKHRDSNENNVENVRNSFKKRSSFDESFNDTCLIMNESMNFGVMDDFSFSVCTSKVTNSQNQKNFNCPNAKDVKRVDKLDEPRSPEKSSINTKQQSPKLIETVKRFAPSPSRQKKLVHTSETIQLNAEHSLSSLSVQIEESNCRTPDDLLAKNINLDRNSANVSKEKSKFIAHKSELICNDKEKAVQLNDDKEKHRLSIKSRLLQFKCNDVSTPAESDNSSIPDPEVASVSNGNKETSQNKPPSSSATFNSFESILCNSDDSDDELLSQVDVDGIFNDYEKQN